MNRALSILLVFFAGLLLLHSCKTVQLSPEQYDKAKIYFGNGGGFSGKLNEFCILSNGEVYAVNPASREATLRNTASRSDTKSLFKKIENANLNQYPYDKPGNMFFWMKHHTQSDTTYLIWGNQDIETDTNVINIYEQLVAMTKQAKP